jgi:2-polyprenyl-6-hydroxyphenyl methylase/3-demethylubiquinone-9 3-methyltransferase
MSAAASSIIVEEVARFDALGDDWWDPAGPMAPLHQINPIRIAWLRDTIAAHFQRTLRPGDGPLEGLSILDIGCGAGLLSEPLSRLGADVTGLDPAAASIGVAQAHARATGAELTYRTGTVEDLARERAKFDVVLAMEVVEHVHDVAAFVARAASLVRPGGLFALSTLNRTLKSFALAIVGAEYVLRWLPAGTHRWEQFVTPDELAAALRAAGLKEKKRQGMVYEPLRREWKLSRDLGVNYFMAAG